MKEVTFNINSIHDVKGKENLSFLRVRVKPHEEAWKQSSLQKDFKEAG